MTDLDLEPDPQAWIIEGCGRQIIGVALVRKWAYFSTKNMADFASGFTSRLGLSVLAHRNMLLKGKQRSAPVGYLQDN